MVLITIIITLNAQGFFVSTVILGVLDASGFVGGKKASLGEGAVEPAPPNHQSIPQTVQRVSRNGDWFLQANDCSGAQRPITGRHTELVTAGRGWMSQGAVEHVCGARMTSVASRPTGCGRDMVHPAHEACMTQYPPGQMYRDRVRPTWRAHQGAGHMARRVAHKRHRIWSAYRPVGPALGGYCG